MQNIHLTPVEQYFLTKSSRKSRYPGEHIPIIETENVHDLGKLVALRFIEWVAENTDGVIALPTGKSPEYFIKYLIFYKRNWKKITVQNELHRIGIDHDQFPETSHLKFVQLDEFYPIDPAQANSFMHYIHIYYLPYLELKKENILLIDIESRGVFKKHGLEKVFSEGKVDLSLCERTPENLQERLQRQALQEVDEFCVYYENKIKEWGGIGFFLGGIGPDGHVAFNLKGSSHHSITRLIVLNYQSAAAAATSLGGIEYARDKVAMTIGLNSITRIPDATIIIMAAGEAKSLVVAQAIEHEESVDYPASAFGKMRGARFYLTKGAASALSARRCEDLKIALKNETSLFVLEEVIPTVALNVQKPILKITKDDFLHTPEGKVFIENSEENYSDELQNIHEHLSKKLEDGIKISKNKVIIHTAPHHDDIMLSYYSYAQALLTSNTNYFVYVTSGFNSVSNQLLKKYLALCTANFLHKYQREIFGDSYETLLKKFKSAFDCKLIDEMQHIEYLLFLHMMCKTFSLSSIEGLQKKLIWLENEYLSHQYPGQKNTPDVQRLKGYIRETEADRLWCINNVPKNQVIHLRSKFYTGDFFNSLPTIKDDAQPMYELLKHCKPDIVTVAFDPKGTGPDTHYKVLQVVAEALRMAKDLISPTILCYRNVWHRFKLSEATLFIPVSINECDELHRSFMSCFSSQRAASFPSPEYDGPFSKLVIEIAKKQLKMVKRLLGKEYFMRHRESTIRNATGLIFLKQMNIDEFILQAKQLGENM